MTSHPVMARLAAACAALLAIAGCSPGPDAEPGEAAPPLYEIRGQDGEVEGWMLGTIHALPDGTRWRTPQIEQAIAEADSLIVEIEALDNASELQDIFQQLATSPGQPDILRRVDSATRPALRALIDRSEYEREQFAGIETWAVALMLARVSAQGEAGNGVDRVVIADFDDRPIIEFEGAEVQLGIFDQLAEADQRDLLEGVIAETEMVDSDPGRLRRAWLNNDTEALIQTTQSGIMADPELREALLVQRNNDWIAQLGPILAASDKPLIAVGAAHLVGPDGMITMLEGAGFSVRSLH